MLSYLLFGGKQIFPSNGHSDDNEAPFCGGCNVNLSGSNAITFHTWMCAVCRSTRVKNSISSVNFTEQQTEFYIVCGGAKVSWMNSKFPHISLTPLNKPDQTYSRKMKTWKWSWKELRKKLFTSQMTLLRQHKKKVSTLRLHPYVSIMRREVVTPKRKENAISCWHEAKKRKKSWKF